MIFRLCRLLKLPFGEIPIKFPLFYCGCIAILVGVLVSYIHGTLGGIIGTIGGLLTLYDLYYGKNSHLLEKPYFWMVFK